MMKIKGTIVFILLLMELSCSKSSNSSGGDNNISVPTVKITGVTQNRKDIASTFRFIVDLNVVSNKTVSVQFATADGTAIAAKDFIAQSGTLTFQPGIKQLFIDIQVTGDSLRQAAQVFTIQLSSPNNGTLAFPNATGTILNDGTYLPTDSTGYVTADSYAGYHLQWKDEFDEKALNTNDWNYETGGSGWGNNELENYTSRPQNVFLSNGNLVIEARSESYSGNRYTSARLTTAGKQQFQFGRIDIRAKLPVKSGLWPALWMLGSNITQAGWPGCGETDIMELVGTNPSQVVGTFHWKKADGSHAYNGSKFNLSGEDFSNKFHVFSLIWSQDSLQILVDDQVYISTDALTIGSSVYPFNAPSFFIFNVAVGGDWPGPPADDTVFPQRMFVDYVRVFQK